MAKNTVAQTNFLVWIRRWLPGLLKSQRRIFCPKNGTYTGLPQNANTAQNSEQPEPVKVTADEVKKIMQAANISQPDAEELLAVSRGEFVEGISDPNDPKWVKGIQTRDSVNQNQQETEQNDQKAEQNSPNTQQNEPETKQPEPVVQQEPERSAPPAVRAVAATALIVVR